MNCKPGDLAIVVKVGPYPQDQKYIGAVLKVLGPGGPDPEGGFFYWSVEHHKILEIPDDYLKPLQDPGEDAKDETLSWLPVPEKTLEKTE